MSAVINKSILRYIPY